MPKPKLPQIQIKTNEDGTPDLEAAVIAMGEHILEALIGYTDERTQQLEEALTRPPEDPKPDEAPRAEGDPLMQRLANLEKTLAERDAQIEQERQAALKSEFAQQLSKSVAGHGPRPELSQAVLDLLAARLDGHEKTEAGWIRDGQTLEESVKGFFGSPEGKAFLPATSQPGPPLDAGKTQPEGDKGISLQDVAKAFG